jgi:hypothetical protein
MYYVVWDTATKRCLLSNIPPNGKTTTLIGVTAYLTRDEAKTAKRMAAACKTVHK